VKSRTEDGARRIGNLRRFMVDEIRPENGSVSIRGQEARHISKVLRIGPGDSIILMDRKGARFLARIESVGPNEVTVSLLESLQPPPCSPLEITLCQSVLRPGPMDFVIQKTSELGVTHIFPFVAERTVVRPDEKGRANKLRHWEEIASGASKQSNRGRPPGIHPVLPFSELLTQFKTGKQLKVMLWEGEETQDLKGVIRNHESGPGAIGIIGPEGGFAPAEVERAVSAGFEPVSMGQRILRAETAAIAFVAVLQYEWGDLGSQRSEAKDQKLRR